MQVVPSRDMRVSASSGNDVDVEAIVSDLQEKVRLVACLFFIDYIVLDVTSD